MKSSGHKISVHKDRKYKKEGNGAKDMRGEGQYKMSDRMRKMIEDVRKLRM
ncbi:MAG: hypothetical protein PHV93_04345 [Candidatus Pacebacteria bacterium]|nr:hypothetical protein [Candidatus Paceibacterota bacterium]